MILLLSLEVVDVSDTARERSVERGEMGKVTIKEEEYGPFSVDLSH